jgi:hypothetical protein
MATLLFGRLPRELRDAAARFLSPLDVAPLLANRSVGAARVVTRAYERRCGAVSARDAIRAELVGGTAAGLPPPLSTTRFCGAVARERAVATLLGDATSSWQNAGYELRPTRERRKELGGIRAALLTLQWDEVAYRASLFALDSAHDEMQLASVPALAPLLERHRAYALFTGRDWVLHTRRQMAELAVDLVALLGDRVLAQWRDTGDSVASAAALRHAFGPALAIGVRVPRKRVTPERRSALATATLAPIVTDAEEVRFWKADR